VDISSSVCEGPLLKVNSLNKSMRGLEVQEESEYPIGVLEAFTLLLYIATHEGHAGAAYNLHLVQI